MEGNTPKVSLEKVNQYFEKNDINLKCPFCGGVQNWNLDNNVYELRKFNQGNLIVGGQAIVPLVVLTHSCGHIVFFNAIKLGVLNNNDRTDR